jgi:OFA family oxalate/formate antiporter-like MFS transporter
MTEESTKGLPNRWLLAGGGVLMQLALGAVYAWSVFRNPLIKTFGWSISDVTTTFSIAILVLGFAAFLGGLWMRRVGPRMVGITAGLCYGLGVALASLSNGNIWILWLTYGVLGGLGLGLGYIVPLATLVKWFPDRRGFITGLAVAGFGAGALLTAPVADYLISGVGVLKTLAILGIDYLIMVVLGASIMRNPPEGWLPKGWQPSTKQQDQLQARNYTLKEALSTWQWYVLWAMLFLNVTAGISIISQASPMAQEISGVSAAVGAGMVGIISIANGIGRLLWAWLSDAIGRRNVFPDHVPAASDPLFPLTVAAGVYGARHFVFYRPELLRRRFRHHAGVRRRLLWSEVGRADLWIDADGLGVRRRLWAAANRQYPPEDWKLRRSANNAWMHLIGFLHTAVDFEASSGGGRPCWR